MNLVTDEPWNCEVDGHEMEQQGEYDPDTNSYPVMICKYCHHESMWLPEDSLDY